MANYKIKALLIALCLAVSGLMHGQILKRQVIGSGGMSFQDANIRVAATLGQSHPTGTQAGGQGVIRVGFQQPPSSSQNDCGLVVTFDADEQDNGVCGSTYTFTFAGTTQSGLTFFWNFGEGAQPATATGMVPPTVVYTSTGVKIASLTVSFNECAQTSILPIEVTQTGFAASVTATDINCFGDTDAAAGITVFGGIAPYSYEWSNGDTTVSVEGLPAGPCSVTVIDANNCEYTAQKVIYGPPAPLSLTATIVDETCENTNDGSITLNIAGGTAPYSVSWQGSATTTTQLTGLGNGAYATTVTDANGCAIDNLFNILEFCTEGGDSIPDVFTPNGDGINDEWILPGIENYPNNEVYIYSRWGEPIFTARPYSNGSPWTGTNGSGEPLQATAYFFVILLNDGFDTKFSGSITIIK